MGKGEVSGRGGKAGKAGLRGFPKLTNEVQHLVKVLSWESIMSMSPLKSGVRLPDYMPWDNQSAKSRQVWIARHRQWLGS